MSAPEPGSPLTGFLPPGRHGATRGEPVRINERRCTLVQVQARNGRGDALAASIHAGLGLELPAPGKAAYAAGIGAMWIAPAAWMLDGPSDDGHLLSRVLAAAGNDGSVVDQTHGRCTIALSGHHAPRVLGKLCRLDLHLRAFPPGSVAVTDIAGLSCILHRRDADGFAILVASSFAGWFAEALLHACAETGAEVTA